jgi:hypothetical protein
MAVPVVVKVQGQIFFLCYRYFFYTGTGTGTNWHKGQGLALSEPALRYDNGLAALLVTTYRFCHDLLGRIHLLITGLAGGLLSSLGLELAGPLRRPGLVFVLRGGAVKQKTF